MKADSLSIRVVDISLRDIAVTTNELPSVRYDFASTGLVADADPTGRHVYNPICIGVNQTSQ